jgi:uncharacterized membrane protein
MDQQALVSAALAGLLALLPAGVAAQEKQEKCWGIAKAGQNACDSNGSEHTCGRKSRTDYDPNDYQLVKAGTCLEMGGSLKQGEPGRLAKEKAKKT